MALTSSRPQYVVDASVVVKWHLHDEEGGPEAIAVLSDFRENRIQLIAPDHIRYEVPNAIRRAVRTSRLTSDDARTAIEDFLRWRIPTVNNDELILSGYDRSAQLGCSLYDGLYLALADSIGCSFVHADRRLHNVVGARFPLALWLTNYVPLG